MTPLMLNRQPLFSGSTGMFTVKWRFVSQGFEIIKDEISCLIRFSQDLPNRMHLDCCNLSSKLKAESINKEQLLFFVLSFQLWACIIDKL